MPSHSRTTASDTDKRVIHACPSDGTEHENTTRCICGPTRLPNDEHGNQQWQHHGNTP